MRPGRLTPENLLRSKGLRSYRPRFNEAGAINPGKPSPRPNSARPDAPGFNEAGAINPGKPASDTGPGPRSRSFNEAGAINPGKPAPSSSVSRPEAQLQ